MEFIGLFSNQQIFLPKDFDEQKNSLIIKLKHTQTTTRVYWYLDSIFIKMTQDIHEVSIQPKKGKHVVTVVDGLGNELSKAFKIL